MSFERIKEYFMDRLGSREMRGADRATSSEIERSKQVNEQLKLEVARRAAELALQTETRPEARKRIQELGSLGIEIPEGKELAVYDEFAEKDEGYTAGKNPRESQREYHWTFGPDVAATQPQPQAYGAEKIKIIGGQDIYGRIGPVSAVQGVESATTRIFYYEEPRLDGLPPGYTPEPKFTGVYENYYVREPGQALSAKNIKWIGAAEKMIGKKPQRIDERRGRYKDDAQHK